MIFFIRWNPAQVYRKFTYQILVSRWQGNSHLKVELKVEVSRIEGLDTDVSILTARRKAFPVRMESNRVDWTEMTLVWSIKQIKQGSTTNMVIDPQLANCFNVDIQR